MQFCCSSNSAAMKFSVTFITPLPWAFLTLKELNMTPSQRLCLTIHHTKHLFRGQRKECCISTGLVEGKKKKPWCDNLNLIHGIDWGIVSSPFFLLAFPFVNTKLRWPINITWCGDAKQELMTGVCVWESVCMAGPYGILLRQAGMVRVWSLSRSLCVSLSLSHTHTHNVDCFFSPRLYWAGWFLASVLTCLSLALWSPTVSALFSLS